MRCLICRAVEEHFARAGSDCFVLDDGKHWRSDESWDVCGTSRASYLLEIQDSRKLDGGWEVRAGRSIHGSSANFFSF